MFCKREVRGFVSVGSPFTIKLETNGCLSYSIEKHLQLLSLNIRSMDLTVCPLTRMHIFTNAFTTTRKTKMLTKQLCFQSSRMGESLLPTCYENRNVHEHTVSCNFIMQNLKYKEMFSIQEAISVQELNSTVVVRKYS